MESITKLDEDTFEVMSLGIIIKDYTSKKLPVHLLEWTLNLVEQNMRQMYENCAWDWKPKAKMQELKSKQARFLIAFERDEPVGFIHYRYVIDYGRKVVYCYELQLIEEARGKGLGKILMGLLENFTLEKDRSIIVLTVLKENERAISFYKKLRFDTDETNPSKSENAPYIILSKSLNSVAN